MLIPTCCISPVSPVCWHELYTERVSLRMEWLCMQTFLWCFKHSQCFPGHYKHLAITVIIFVFITIFLRPYITSSQYIARLHLKTEHFGKLLDQVYNADCLSLHLSSSIMLSRHNVSATSLSRVCVPFVWSYSKCVGEVGWLWLPAVAW